MLPPALLKQSALVVSLFTAMKMKLGKSESKIEWQALGSSQTVILCPLENWKLKSQILNWSPSDLSSMWLTAPSEVCWPLYYVSSQIWEWLEKQTDSMFRTQNGSLKLFVMDLGWHPSIYRSLDLVSEWWFFGVESCAAWLRDFAAGSNRCWVLTNIHQLIEEFVICLS